MKVFLVVLLYCGIYSVNCYGPPPKSKKGRTTTTEAAPLDDSIHFPGQENSVNAPVSYIQNNGGGSYGLGSPIPSGGCGGGLPGSCGGSTGQQVNNPHYPNKPSNPQYPNNPSSPQYPSNPSDPQYPNNPSNPQYPNNPNNPSNPQYPNNPNNPSNPQYPNNPNSPSNPQYPNNPSNPQYPNNPNKPQYPNNPSSSQYPNTPNSPQNSNNPQYPQGQQPNPPSQQPGGSYWWQGASSPFNPQQQAPSPSAPSKPPHNVEQVSPPHSPNYPGSQASNPLPGQSQPGSPQNQPTGGAPPKPIDIQNNPFLSSALGGNKPSSCGSYGGCNVQATTQGMSPVSSYPNNKPISCAPGSAGGCNSGLPSNPPLGTYPQNPPPSPVNSPSNPVYSPSKPVDINSNPFLSSALNNNKPTSGCAGSYSGGCGATQQPISGNPQIPIGQNQPQGTQQPGQQYPGSTQYPVSQQPGQIGQGNPQYPGSQSKPLLPGLSQYPSTQQPEKPQGTPQYPENQKPGQAGYPGSQPGLKPQGSQQYPGSNQYPSYQQTGQPGSPQSPGSNYQGPQGNQQYPNIPRPNQQPGQQIPNPQPLGQPDSPLSYPGSQPGSPASQYPGNEYPNSQNPSQQQGGKYPLQQPGQQPTVNIPGGRPQYPNSASQGKPSYPQYGSGQTPGQYSPQYPSSGVSCNQPNQLCVAKSACQQGVLTQSGVPGRAGFCNAATEVCCRIPTGATPDKQAPPTIGYGNRPGTNGVPIGGSIYDNYPKPSLNSATPAPTQQPYTGPQNTTPYPGCPAALKCVPITYCTVEGVMADNPVTLTREQQENRVPLTDCMNLDTNTQGKCCRDPNYKDPWPAGMMMGKMPSGGGFDDGQYHPPASDDGQYHPPAEQETSGTFSHEAGIYYNVVTSTPKGHTIKKPIGNFNQNPTAFPMKPSIVGSAPRQPAPVHENEYPEGVNPPSNEILPPNNDKNAPSPLDKIQPGGQAYQPGQAIPGGGSYSPINNGGTGYQPIQAKPAPQPGQPSFQPQSPKQPSYQPIPAEQPKQPDNLSPAYQPGQPGSSSYQPGQPGGSSYQPGQPGGSSYQPGQPGGSSYQPGQQPEGSSYKPGQPESSSSQPGGSSYQPKQPGGSSYQPGQAPSYQPNSFNNGQPLKGFPIGQPRPGSTCGIRHQADTAPEDAGFAEFPWQALVSSASNKTYVCGAAIISENAVITAAHCVEELRSKEIVIKAGEWKLLTPSPKPVQVRPAAAVARHPEFSIQTLSHDLAIIVISQAFAFDDHVDKICLPSASTASHTSSNCVVTGWGRKQLKGLIPESVLHKVDVKFIPEDECESSLKSTHLGKYFILNKGFSCALPKNPSDLCKVDVGSPIACDRGDGHYELAGVNSWDVGCQNEQTPTIASNPDAEWIEKIINTPTEELVNEEEKYFANKLKGESIDDVDIDQKPGFALGYGK